MTTLHEFYQSLRFGERYHKPLNVSWHDLEHQINDAGKQTHFRNHAYWSRFQNYRLRRLRGDMFCLECKCCGSIGDQRYT